MGTFTTRLNLFKPDPNPVTGDDVDVTDLNDNSDKMDAAAGFTVCTSGTRPGSPWDGQPIYETDTNLYYAWVEGAWTLITPNATTSLRGVVELATNAEAVTGADTERAVTPAGVKAVADAVLQLIFPVGSYYISDSVSTTPATLLGFGSWTAVTDRMLVGAGGSYSAGSTGGAATHTLTPSELPNHVHGWNGAATGTPVGTGDQPFRGSGSLDTNFRMQQELYSSESYGSSALTNNQPHNNMPPYRAVYMWRRTA